MQYTSLGRTALKVSRLCLGTMNFGSQTTEEDSHAIMDEALDKGINFWDTANRYGGKAGAGGTEKIIGRWLAKDKSRRDRVVLATKVYGDMSSDNWPNYRGLSAKSIRIAVEDSLRRLQTDYIDLYQFHHVDRDAPWEEIWQALEQLVQAGKVLYVGSSNFAGWHIAKANEAAKKRNYMGLVSEQSLYNLAARTIELEVIPACEDYGLGLIPWSPLAGGLLGGVLQKIESGRRASERIQKRIEAHRDQIQAYEDFCQELGASPAVVALAWMLENPVVTAPIIGPRTMEQLTSAYDALELHLDADAMQKLDEIWPGPGGTAPEAYAW
ncbi:MAG: aldo/keto reductase [Anaerolineae bacterium]|nr:aldo/keto reductase [Anaerolineae bacterium]